MKFIVDGEFWKTTCQGVKCCDCTMFDEKHDCRINTYIHKQPRYREERKVKGSGMICIGYDFSDGKDVSVLNVMQRDKNGVMRISKVFYGAEAERLYNKLVQKEGDGE